MTTEYVMVPREANPEMIDAYLRANDAYWKRMDEVPPPPNKWRTGTPKDATAESYRAMLQAAPPAPVAHSKSEYKRRVAMGDASILPPATVAVQPAPVAQALRDLVAVLREYGSFPPKLIPALLSAEQALASPSPAPVAELVVTDAPRYVVKKESGSEWARVIDTQTGMQVCKYSVLPRRRSTRDGWDDAQRHAKRLNDRAILAAQSGAGTRGEKT